MINTLHRSKLTPNLLVGLFVLPIVLAYVTYYSYDRLQLKTTHHGLLLSPAIPVSKDFLNLGKWQLIALQQDLSSLEAIHRALGKHQSKLIYQTISRNSIPELKEGEYGIIDPKGFLIMRYPESTDLQMILKDLKRLIGATHVH